MKILSIRKGINGFPFSICDESGNWIGNFESIEKIRDYYSYEVKTKSVRLKKQTGLFPIDAEDHKPVQKPGRTFGYCRVSTMKQSIERQIRNIKAQYPDALIVTDEYTGTKLDRPGWTRLYKQLKPGDTVVFDQVSRMSRDADEGFRVYEDLFNLGVNLIFLKEPHINTSVYHEVAQAPETGDKDLDETLIRGLNEYLMRLAKKQIQLAFDQAEKEVEDLHQRTREGIRERKRKNAEILFKYNGNIDKARTDSEWGEVGQPKGAKLTTKKSIEAKEVILKRSKDFNGDLSDLEVMKLTGVARGTYYKYKRELKSEDR